jgi:hypothetical protein
MLTCAFELRKRTGERHHGPRAVPLNHRECYVGGAAIEEAVFAWNCGMPDAWYPSLGWTNVEGGPPARQAEVDETYVGSQGRAVAARSVAVVEQVDNIWIDENLHIGSSEAPMHLWIWRPLALRIYRRPRAPRTPRAPSMWSPSS